MSADICTGVKVRKKDKMVILLAADDEKKSVFNNHHSLIRIGFKQYSTIRYILNTGIRELGGELSSVYVQIFNSNDYAKGL